MVESKPFKILSIDGGGIKGLFSAIILNRLEQEFCKQDEAISDYFDMICGTSTGGLIALGISRRIPLSKIVDFYKNDGPNIFPYKTTSQRVRGFARQLLLSAKYDSGPLKEALVKVFGDDRMRDAKNLLCIPSYNLIQGRPTIFKSPFYHIDNPWKFDKEKLMIDVALATAAAPTYFPVHQIDTEYYADGGVWANNPTLCGFLEAMKFFYNKEMEINKQKIRYDRIQILSVSSVSQPTGWSTKRGKNLSARKWLSKNKIIQPFMEGQNYLTHFFMTSIADLSLPNEYGILDYFRIEHKPLSCEQTSNIDLDKATPAALQQLKSIAEDTVRFYYSSKKNVIEHFFSSPKTYITQN